MTPRLEELAGKLLLIAAFGYLAVGQMVGVAQRVVQGQWDLGLAASVLSLAFVLLVVVMTLRRLPSRQNAAGIEPRLMAILGTFLLLLLVWLPPGRPPAGVQLAATLLLVIGTAASIWCLHHLGRSFAILAAARELVTGGPYGIVRHPLYLAEAVSTIGIIVLHWSWPAVVVGTAQLAVQLRRMHHEERVLRAAFPEYGDYARRVPMLLPGAARG